MLEPLRSACLLPESIWKAAVDALPICLSLLTTETSGGEGAQILLVTEKYQSSNEKILHYIAFKILIQYSIGYYFNFNCSTADKWKNCVSSLVAGSGVIVINDELISEFPGVGR